MKSVRIMRWGIAFLLLVATFIPSAVHAQKIPTWHLTQGLPVGQDHDFTRIIAMVPMRNGDVAIGDGGGPELSVFGANGEFVRRIGGVGEGPGEFVTMGGAGLLGDSVWVIDFRQRRTTFFSPEGKVLQTVRNEALMSMTAIVAGAALGSVGAGFDSPHVFKDEVLPVFRVTRAGKIQDTLAWIQSKNLNFALRLPDGSYNLGKQPFTDAGLSLIDPNGSSVFILDRTASKTSSNASFTVSSLSLHGDTIWKRKYSYTPRRLPKNRTDSLRAVHEKGLLKRGVTRKEIADALFTPDYYAPVTAAFGGTDGSLWLRREEDGPNVDYWILDKDGRVAGLVNVPAILKIMAATQTDVFAMSTDADGIPSVYRYKVSR